MTRPASLEKPRIKLSFALLRPANFSSSIVGSAFEEFLTAIRQQSPPPFVEALEGAKLAYAATNGALGYAWRSVLYVVVGLRRRRRHFSSAYGLKKSQPA